MRRSFLTLASAALFAAMFVPATGHAADGAVSAAGLQFVPRVVVLPEGSGLVLANADPVAAAFGNGHNLVHVSQNPKFSSSIIEIGQTANVKGVSALLPGEYAMRCSVHPAVMTGVLRIVAT